MNLSEAEANQVIQNVKQLMKNLAQEDIANTKLSGLYNNLNSCYSQVMLITEEQNLKEELKKLENIRKELIQIKKHGNEILKDVWRDCKRLNYQDPMILKRKLKEELDLIRYDYENTSRKLKKDIAVWRQDIEQKQQKLTESRQKLNKDASVWRQDIQQKRQKSTEAGKKLTESRKQLTESRQKLLESRRRPRSSE